MENLNQLSEGIRNAMPNLLPESSSVRKMLPDRESIADICNTVLSLFFPGFFNNDTIAQAHIDTYSKTQIINLRQKTLNQVCKAKSFDSVCKKTDCDKNCNENITTQIDSLMKNLPEIAALIFSDIEAAFKNDPSANSKAEILVSYPCVIAITIQRVAHQLYLDKVPLIPRMMTEWAHSITGVDMHPGASIGKHFFIDHATGVVIGETCIIGDNCVLYHGVTLGAFNPLSKNSEGELERGESNKRHPTLKDNIVVYPGATILGGDTVIGPNSIIGGNVWLTHSVKENSLVINGETELIIKDLKKK